MKVAALIACLVVATLAVHQTPKQSLLCDVCRFVGKEVNMRILDESTKKEFLEAASEICLIMPSPWNNKCLDTISEHGPAIVEEIFKTLDLEDYCEEIKFNGEYMCPHNSTVDVSSQVKDGEGCQACKDTLDMVRMLITSDDMKDLIHVAINETCMAIGANVESCEAITGTVIDEILGNLLPMFNGDALCRFAGACPMPSWLAAHSSGVGCLLCKDGFGILEGVASSAELADILNVAVNQTCELAGFAKGSCDQIGSLISNQLLSALKQIVNPDMVCAKLGACPATAVKELFQATVQDKEGCKACMDGLDIVQLILTADETEDLVHIAVHELCMAMGGVADTCTKIVEGVIDPILKQLIFQFNPATLCKKAGACPTLQLVNEDGKLCDFCMDGIMEVKNIAADKATQDMLNELTGLICDTISIPFCRGALNTVVKELLQGLESLNPNTTCSTLDACSSFHVEEGVNGPICSACSAATNMVINGLVNNKEFHVLVNKAIHGMCKVIPSDDCVTWMDEGFTAVMAILKSYGGIGVCDLIGLC